MNKTDSNNFPSFIPIVLGTICISPLIYLYIIFVKWFVIFCYKISYRCNKVFHDTPLLSKRIEFGILNELHSKPQLSVNNNDYIDFLKNLHKILHDFESDQTIEHEIDGLGYLQRMALRKFRYNYFVKLFLKLQKNYNDENLFLLKRLTLFHSKISYINEVFNSSFFISDIQAFSAVLYVIRMNIEILYVIYTEEKNKDETYLKKLFHVYEKNLDLEETLFGVVNHLNGPIPEISISLISEYLDIMDVLTELSSLF